MISELEFPDLSLIMSQRASAVLLVRKLVGDISPNIGDQLIILVSAFARISDGVILDYTNARSAYYEYFNCAELGSSVPITERLIPYLHYIENCICNIERAYEMGKAICSFKLSSPNILPLIEKSAWRVAKEHEKPIADFRNALQHLHRDLKSGKVVSGAIEYRDDGAVVLGQFSLSVIEIANAIKKLHAIANAAVIALPKGMSH
jgi:hypothetical protein